MWMAASQHRRRMQRLIVSCALIAFGAQLAIWAQAPQPVSVSASSRGAAPAKPAFVQHSGRMFGAQPVTKIKQDRDGGRAMPDDPLAAIKSALALPPNSISVAPFVGDATVIAASSSNGLAIARQSDCSLTAANVPYGEDISEPYSTPVSAVADYNQLLHSEAGLITVGGQFNGKCPDPTTGIASSDLLYAGTSTGGMHMAAIAEYSPTTGYNVLDTFVINSTGGFVSSTRQALPATSQPYGLVAADLNGDGNPDLVAVGWSSSGSTNSTYITVLLGKADGTFTIGQTYDLGVGISDSAVIDDFNGDGKLDVVVPVNGAVGTGSGVLTFLPGNGDGAFGAAKTLALTTAAESLVSADFNGDGKKDLASGRGQIFLGNGDGTFSQQSTPLFTSLETITNSSPQLAVGDFNKDGKLDIAVGTGGSIYIYLGNGNGAFILGNTYAGIGNKGYLTATDLDGDGNLDLFSGNARGGAFYGDDLLPNEGYALMGRGDGTFVGAPQVTTANFNTLQDYNGDGKLDFIGLSTSTPATLATYYGNGDGTFKQTGAPLTLSTYTYQGTQYTYGSTDSYTVGDLNSDGHPDAVFIPGGYYNTNPTRLGYLTALGNADGSFQTPTFTPAPTLIAGAPAGQDYINALGQMEGVINQNGKFEIIYSYEASISVSTGSGFATDYYSGYATQVSNGDGTFAAPALTVANTSGIGLPPVPVSTVDLNGDKIPDMIVFVPAIYGLDGIITSPSELEVMLGNSDGTFQQPVTLSAFSNPVGYNFPIDVPISVADVNGDGIPDIAVETSAISGNNINYYVVVALGKGDGTFTAKTTLALNNVILGIAVAIGDFTGDGKADLAVFNRLGTSGIFPGNGDGAFQTVADSNNPGTVDPPLTIQVYSSGTGAAAAYDLAGNGSTDLLAGDTFFIPTGAATTLNTSTTALKASASSITVGQSLTLTATITASSGAATPTGTSTFLDGTTTLGVGTLNSSAVATLSTTSLTAGTHTLTATYSGDTNFAASTSSTVSVTVAAPPALAASTTALSASASTATTGQSITLTATVKPPSGDATIPTGAVTFLNGVTSLGKGTLNSSGVATLATTTLPTGSDSITAQYGGDSNFSPSTSTAVVIVVSAATPDFTLTLSPGSATVASGSSTTTTVSIQPSGGFTQAVTFACSGLPSDATCSFAPTTVTPTGGSAATTTLTLSTTAASARIIAPAHQEPNKMPSRRSTFALALSLLGITGIIRSRSRLHRHIRNTVLLCLLSICSMTLISILNGCGGSSPKTTTGTSPTTSTITVTATAGSLIKTTTFTLTVD